MPPTLIRLSFVLIALFTLGGATARVASPEATSGALKRGAANPILRNDSPYDDLKVGPSTIVKVGPGDYRQWYEAIDYQNKPSSTDFLSQTGYAVSSDGTTWTKKGVVFAPLSAPSWERSEACPTSMHWDGSKWILFYHGGNNANPRAIGRATSPTGTGNFTRLGKPVLERGPTGAWDGGFVADAKVIPPWEGPDGLWRMYYIGRRTLSGEGQVGLATSPDGITFTRVGAAPVLGYGPSGAWDDGNIQAFAPEWDAREGLFRAWYVAGRSSGGGGNAGYAWSLDGKSWTRSPANPVLTSVSGDSVQDSIDAYADGDRYRIVYGQYDLSANPPLRGKGEAYFARGPETPTEPGPSPSTTAAFRIMSGSDDGDVERGGATYPPAAGTVADGSASWSTVSVRRSKATSSYQPVRVGLLRFDTSSLPDDATVVSAQLRVHVTGVKSTDGRSLVAEWYPASAWPIDGDDWALADSSSAHAGTALGSITAGQEHSLELRNLQSISLTGPTAVRLHVSGNATAPTGPNDLAIAAHEHPTLAPATLVVQYTRP